MGVFFVSYSRADVEHKPFQEVLEAFVDELSARVAQEMRIPKAAAAYFDASNHQLGDLWPAPLQEALRTVPVAVPLYSPNYFSRPWCGREFQAFLERSPGHPRTGIVPVLWTRNPPIPKIAQDYQYTHAAFPDEYVQMGMQGLVKLRASLPLQFERAIQVIADRIVYLAKNGHGLQPAPRLVAGDLRSAWDLDAAVNPAPHTEAAVSKTCFVYAAQQGWRWQPYPRSQGQIGAVAQRISGDLGLQYEEIRCDRELKDKLAEMNRRRVPTIIFGDPSSLLESTFATPMQDYDNQYLLNCATLVPWDEASKAVGDGDTRWTYIRTRVCRQKTEVPPPFHEWRSIFSHEDLESKTRTIIEQVRSRLLQSVLSSAGAAG